MSTDRLSARQAGNELVVAQAQRQVQTFFDELKNGTSNYRTVASLDAQIAQEYRGRCILELLQNAHALPPRPREAGGRVAGDMLERLGRLQDRRHRDARDVREHPRRD